MIYRYSAYTGDKKIVSGTIESGSMEMAEASLYRAGFKRILRLQQSQSRIDFRKAFFGPPRINRQALLGLKQIERQSKDTAQKTVVSKLAAELQAGTPFYKSLGMHPQVFNETYCAIIEANEKAGTLDKGLRQIAKELKQQIEMRSQISRATTQPAIIVVLAIGVLILMSIVVLPPLANIFRQFGSQLPLTTRFLIGFSDFVSNYKYYILIVLFLLVLIGALVVRDPKSKRSIDRIMLKVPVLGDIMIWHNTARFTRTMSNLLGAGILLPDTINIMLRTVNNSQFRESLAEIRKQLVQGQSLSAAIGKDKLFPQLLVEMASVGEASGELESALGTVADYFEAKTEKRINRLTALLEPTLILAVGLIVAFLAISMISTIYGLIGSFNPG
jgi:type IV pilus assembly protein PilC